MALSLILDDDAVDTAAWERAVTDLRDFEKTRPRLEADCRGLIKQMVPLEQTVPALKRAGSADYAEENRRLEALRKQVADLQQVWKDEHRKLQVAVERFTEPIISNTRNEWNREADRIRKEENYTRSRPSGRQSRETGRETSLLTHNAAAIERVIQVLTEEGHQKIARVLYAMPQEFHQFVDAVEEKARAIALKHAETNEVSAETAARAMQKEETGPLTTAIFGGQDHHVYKVGVSPSEFVQTEIAQMKQDYKAGRRA